MILRDTQAGPPRIYLTQTLSGLLAAVFAVTVATHSIRLWIVYLLALLLGFVNVFDNPARQSLALELAALVFVGHGSITFNALAKTTLQLTARPEMRGRVMALWALAWLGSTPVGGPIVGWAGQVIGARWSLVIGGVATVACGVLALPALTRIDRRPAPVQAEPELTAQAR